MLVDRGENDHLRVQAQQAALFGLRHFSMHPAHLLGVKQRVLMTSIPDISPVVARILKTDEPEKLQALIERLNA